MVVDGLDHAYRADLEATKKLLTVLPEHLPHGVVCLIGAQGTQYLLLQSNGSVENNGIAGYPYSTSIKHFVTSTLPTTSQSTYAPSSTAYS